MLASHAGSRIRKLIRHNISAVKELYPHVDSFLVSRLRELTAQLHLSVSKGELLLLRESWYVTHAGLLSIAERRKCFAIQTRVDKDLSDSDVGRWVFVASVYKRSRSKAFVGYGDADPSNVSSLVRGAEMRVAETRAVNRALRKAYGIGICSVEELSFLTPSNPPRRQSTPNDQPTNSNGRSSPQSLRDRLNLLVRQHQLDPVLVKRYAADFCGTQALRDASRELVEDFIAMLAKKASQDLAGLQCQLTSYQEIGVRS
jgi:hypothetical protein